MSLTSPARDHFQLDRLAEELELREGTSAGLSSLVGLPDVALDLPIFIPLSRDNPYLAAEAFDVEAFLLSRVSHADLPDLRSELREYLAALKEELVQLINDDYEAFISLSTDLRGEGTRLERLQQPLGELKERVLLSQGELQTIEESIEAKLTTRTGFRTEKEFLHLLLKISESVDRLESLLLIGDNVETALDEVTDPLDGALAPAKEVDAPEERSRSSRAKHIARVSAEYTQLLYHISKAQAEKSAFVDEIQWRVDRIKSTLSSDLDTLFAATVRTFTDGKEDGKIGKISESEKARLMTDLVDCLRTYDALGLWRDAEDVLRREVVREFVKQTIFPGALAAPLSPMVPQTPMMDGYLNGGPPSSMPPRTPYTPFSAFAAKQNPFDFTFGSANSASNGLSAHLLDETSDPLASLYNRLLRFIDRDLVRIMEAAERICIKSGSRRDIQTKPPLDGAERAARRDESGGFDIMANVVWPEIGRTIMDELGSVIFAAGKPDQFRKHHETTQAFIRSLEFLAPSAEAIQSMRAHPSFSAFDRRWQLPVYFQLRWKEIVTALEVALSVNRLDSAVTTDQEPFVTPQSAATWAAITRCWSAEVYIPELSHRFWRFTLQLLSRYKTWLEASLPSLEVVPNGIGTDQGPGSPIGSARVSTPLPGAEPSNTESIAADNAVLRQLAIGILDVEAMRSQMTVLWEQELSVMLPEDVDATESSRGAAEDALRSAISDLTSLTPGLNKHVVLVLSRHCAVAVDSVKSVPTQIRAHKRTPKEASAFVEGILRPLKVFFGVQSSGGPGTRLKASLMVSCATEAFDGVCKRYTADLVKWKKAEESLRRLHKPTFSLFPLAKTSKEDKTREDERIRAQMILDVNALGKDAQSLGIDVESCESFVSLREMVHTSLIEDLEA